MNRASYTVKQIAEKVGAQIFGDTSVKVSGIKPLETAGEEDLSFFAPTSKKRTAELLAKARQSKAGALFVAEHDESLNCPQLVCPNPLGAVVQLGALFRIQTKPGVGIHPTAVIDPSATVGSECRIGPYAVIGKNVRIGNRCVIYSHVVVYDEAVLGDECVIHAHAVIREGVVLGDDCLVQNGVVLGGDGFGYYPDREGNHQRIPHIGNVRLANHVDVGANTTIDRATLGETKIDEGAKIDNLVMIGHNVIVGKQSLLCAQVGISGSTEIGNHVVLGGQTGVADHVRIADGVRTAAKSGIAGDITEKMDVGGIPERTVGSWHREQIALQKLPTLMRRINKLLKDKTGE